MLKVENHFKKSSKENSTNMKHQHKLQINLAKTKEIVITRCGRRGFMQPPLIPGVPRENLVKLLGVTFNNHLSFADQVRKLQIVAR